MKRLVTVWWGIPCKSMIPVFQALHEEQGRDVRFIALSALPEHRRKLGWAVPPHGSMPLDVLGDDDWQSAASEWLAARDGLHIVNGVYHNARVRYVARALAERPGPFGVIAEAPSNLEAGVKRIVKRVLAPVVTPLRAWRVARKAGFVMSASGDRQAAFRALGFRAGRIFPFGYFPDYPSLERPVPSSADRLAILCIGYLEPFKGQDVLLRALSILKSRDVPFECTITGYGSARGHLVALCERLGLSDRVEFAGVVSNERLEGLFKDSSLLVAPGIEEPWGIRVNEALLAGLPVVVSDGVGAKELIATSGAGEVFQSGSERALADALERAFARLRAGELAETVQRFRPAITPRAAAAYLEQVISMLEAGQMGGARPRPPWLTATPRGDARSA